MRAEARAAFLAAGAALVIVAFASATRVADTREGLIAEVVTLLSSLAAVGLLIYGLTARRGRASASSRERPSSPVHTRATRDLLLGVGGIVLALVLLAGLLSSGGPLWAGLGLVLLLPMIAGSAYLCVRFLRARISPTR